MPHVWSTKVGVVEDLGFENMSLVRGTGNSPCSYVHCVLSVIISVTGLNNIFGMSELVMIILVST